MKSLRNYIEDHKDYSEASEYNYPVDFAQSFNSFLEVNNLTEDSITEDAIDWYCKNVCESDGMRLLGKFSNEYAFTKQYVTEMMNAVQIKQLIKQLNKNLGADGKYHVFLNSQRTEDKDIHELAIPILLYDKETIYETCEKLMWNFTSIYHEFDNGKFGFVSPEYDKLNEVSETRNEISYFFIKVEPEQANNVTDFVKNDCEGIVYHITDSKSAQTIMKSGLRPREQKKTYRIFTRKIFFITNDEYLEQSIKQILKDKNYSDYRILRIDTSNYNIDFYRDTTYRDSRSFVYSYAYFPPKIIKDVTKEIKEKFNL